MRWTGQAKLMMSPVAPIASTLHTEVPDEELMRRLRAGDVSGGEQLVARYYPSLIRYLQRLVGVDQAEELLQQTWLNVLNHADKFQPGSGSGGLRAWLFRIATNKAHDSWRARSRERAAHQGMRLVIDEAEPAADTRLESTEQQEKVRAAIEQLPENQRQVLLLRYYSGLKFVEIAEVVGCPLNTALGRARKALIRLKALMEDERDRVTRK